LEHTVRREGRPAKPKNSLRPRFSPVPVSVPYADTLIEAWWDDTKQARPKGLGYEADYDTIDCLGSTYRLAK
jgi:hypothetical protein